MKPIVRIGTRGSQLALAQSRLVADALQRQHPDRHFELTVIRTTGDRFAETPLATLGGKGVFVKEIEEALLAGTIDGAIHSMKDVPSYLPSGLRIAAVPRRESPVDLLLTPHADRLEALPEGARVGTGSLRRMALLRALRPDLTVIPLRGNVDTRLRRLDNGELDAIVLAAAGLHRLGVQRADAVSLDPDEFIPAVGQGALALETRDDESAAVFETLNDPTTAAAVMAERAFLATVGGSCRTPLGAWARPLQENRLRLQAMIASPDGREVLRAERQVPERESEEAGRDLARELLARGGDRILAELAESGAPT